MVTTETMDHDDDVEHLFSWLQTPDLRYREFAGAREITDAVVSWQARTNTAPPEAVAEAVPVPAPHNAQLHEEYSSNQFPDQAQVLVEVEPAPRGPQMIPPVSPPSALPPPAGPSPSGADPFTLGVAGRSYSHAPADQPRSQPYLTPQTQTQPRPATPPPSAPVYPAEPPQAPAYPAAPPAPPGQTPGYAAPPAPPPAEPAAAPAPPAPPPPPQPAAGLLGGAYRESETNGHAAGTAPPAQPAPAEPQQRGERSLDAVFGRLAGRNRLPDPRDRLRHIPGLGPPAGRSR
jgi:hypothetical protein